MNRVYNQDSWKREAFSFFFVCFLFVGEHGDGVRHGHHSNGIGVIAAVARYNASSCGVTACFWYYSILFVSVVSRKLRTTRLRFRWLLTWVVLFILYVGGPFSLDCCFPQWLVRMCMCSIVHINFFFVAKKKHKKNSFSSRFFERFAFLLKNRNSLDQPVGWKCNDVLGCVQRESSQHDRQDWFLGSRWNSNGGTLSFLSFYLRPFYRCCG